jgi:hypothetical protein
MEAGQRRSRRPSGKRSWSWPASRPDRLPGSRAPRCQVKPGRDRRSHPFRGAGWQREVSVRLEGEQSPWKYRVWTAGNGGPHYGLVGGARPWSRSARNRTGLGLVRERVGGRATRDGARLRVCTVERHRCSRDAGISWRLVHAESGLRLVRRRATAPRCGRASGSSRRAWGSGGAGVVERGGRPQSSGTAAADLEGDLGIRRRTGGTASAVTRIHPLFDPGPASAGFGMHVEHGRPRLRQRICGGACRVRLSG